MQTRSCFLALNLIAAVAAFVGPAKAASFLRVPEDFSTIQAAIDAAPDGATITVAPGRYTENIDFLGKLLLLSGAGPDSVIDGAGRGPVVRFVNGEGPASVLDSFTITGGLATQGAGIEIENSSPTIVRNVIVDNAASGVGSGIFVGGSAAQPAIFNNLLMFNVGVNGGDPHAIQISGSSPRIVNNTLVRNDSNAILTSGSGFPEIRNNILARNGTRFGTFGGKGRGICDFAPGSTVQYNDFFRNVRSALLTAGEDYKSVRLAQELLGRPGLAANLDAAPRFTAGYLPRTASIATREHFLPSVDPLRRSRVVEAGDPDIAYNNRDGTRNTIGFTGGPWAPLP